MKICFSFPDHDRPLSKSGKEDAVRVSRKLQELGWIPELILSRLAIFVPLACVVAFELRLVGMNLPFELCIDLLQ